VAGLNVDLPEPLRFVLMDARGLPKSPYWFLKRALQPLGLFITDEGVNGLHLHVAVRWEGTYLDPASLIRLRLP